MTCLMMEVGVIRHDALERLVCDETTALAGSAADDRWVHEEFAATPACSLCFADADNLIMQQPAYAIGVPTCG